jgi:asparagine synthase (glutamine-hydrolysing)
MCGIAGYVDFEAGPQRAVLDSMARVLHRRGPDAHGVQIDGPCGLAHRRLSIIDIAGSPQPMATPDGAGLIVYNGEIYNYRELRAELEAAGEHLVTSGDTEAVLRYLVREWRQALPRFDGMFAFAAWDRARQRLLLARDAIGEKPLFYATPAPGLLVFGSEAKALIEHPAVDRDVDPDALRQALRFRAVYGSHCLHRGVRQLRPGGYLEFDRSGVRTGVFHDLVESAAAARRALSDRSQADLVARGRDLFFESVRERLVADVPVGAFLSGGLDSSLIVAAMRRLRSPDEEVRTFSVGFTGDGHSELPYAQMVAEAVGSHHTPIEVGPECFSRRLAELSACRDGPVSEPADVAVAEMSRVARQSVKVVLSGEGADEVFAGYPKYALAKTPAVLRMGLRTLGHERTARLAGLAGLNPARVRIAARALSQDREIDRVVQWFSYMDRRDLQTLLPGLGWNDAEWEETVAEQARALAALPEQGPLMRMQIVDCLTWLPGNMLERGDRMTMAEGLEMRPPFLDKALVAFGLGLPDRMKRRGKVGKWIVRQWAAELLPEEIVNRRKWGFRVPLDAWFRGPLRDQLTGYLTGAGGLCSTFGDRAAVQRLLDQHQEGRLDHSAALWSLFAAEIWYQDVHLPRLKETAMPAVA